MIHPVARHTLILMIGVSFLFCSAPGAKSDRRAAVTIDEQRREIRFPATVHPGAMQRPLGVKGHHAIVWKKGRAATWALFKTDASDREIREGLERIGATAGENLTVATWTARGDAASLEPEKRVAGSSVDVFVEWNGSGGRVPLRELLTQVNAQQPHFDFRYGGNQRFQAHFKSGCIVCLYSCPGGAVGNHAKTIRDYMNEGVIFKAKKERLPKAGSTVTVVIRLRT